MSTLRSSDIRAKNLQRNGVLLSRQAERRGIIRDTPLPEVALSGMNPTTDDATSVELAPSPELDPILISRIDAVVRRVVSQRRDVADLDVERMCADVMVAIVERDPDVSIEDFDTYLLLVARRACSAWSRRQNPSLHRLRVHLRTLLKSDGRFILWESAEGVWLCCLDGRKDEPPMLDELAAGDGDAQARHGDAVRAILYRYQRPVSFDALARLCAQIWPGEDRQKVTVASTAPVLKGSGLERSAEDKMRLAKLWQAISELPKRQRTAILLSLRSDDGSGATHIFADFGTASIRKIAPELAMEAEAFANAWNRLPLSEPAIAEHMGVTRQQAINLCQCARERLRTRLKESLASP